MSKQDFTNNLKYGKCKCGGIAQKGRDCPASGVKICPCCNECRERCVEFIKELNKIITQMAEDVKDGADDMVTKHMKDLLNKKNC